METRLGEGLQGRHCQQSDAQQAEVSWHENAGQNAQPYQPECLLDYPEGKRPTATPNCALLQPLSRLQQILDLLLYVQFHALSFTGNAKRSQEFEISRNNCAYDITY